MIHRIKNLTVYLLTRELGTNPLALGVCYGLCLGLTPRLTPQWGILFLGIFILRVNLISAFVTFLVTFFSCPWSFPLFHKLGLFLLVDLPVLHPVWRGLGTAPVLSYLQLNNSVVMGATAVIVILLGPLFWIASRFFRRYRGELGGFVSRSYWWRALTTQHYERRAA